MQPLGKPERKAGESKEGKESKQDEPSSGNGGGGSGRKHTPAVVFMFLELMVRELRAMTPARAQSSENFFDLLSVILDDGGDGDRRRQFLVVKGLLPVLMQRISAEIANYERYDRLSCCSGSFPVLTDLYACRIEATSPFRDAVDPRALYGLILLLREMINVPAIR